MSHKPILTSPSLYEQGAPSSSRRLITGEELLHRIKTHIWGLEGGEHPADFTTSELTAMSLRAVAVFADVTGHLYDSWSARNTYPASLVVAAATLSNREQAVAHYLKAAQLADEDGWTVGATGFRAAADRALRAMA